MAAQIETAAFYRVLSIFSTFNGHAYVSRLNSQAEEPSCLCCHVAGVSIACHGTVRTLPSCLQGWLESPHASRSAPNEWFVRSHLLWSPGECNSTQGGRRASWPERRRPLLCARPLFQKDSHPSHSCMP